MRPVNLIPPNERHGSRSPLRTGPLPYLLVGSLVVVLIGVVSLVLVGNQVSERRTEIVTLKREDAAEQARAQRLSAYVQFAEMRQQRMETVSSLADSRFDWERVMRELSKILPADVWLTSLNASASAGAGGGSESSSGESASGLRGSIVGPALEFSGCAAGQDGVAGLVTALKEIEGVTRVGVQSSALAAGGSSAEAAGGSETGGSSDCRARNFIAQFQMVVAFDAAPVPISPEAAEVTEAAAESTESSESTSATSTTSSGG